MKTFNLFFILLISLLFALPQSGKADTIHVQLPNSIQHFCVDTTNFPVFIFHKPYLFGVTDWYVNDIFFGSGDSIIYTPSSIEQINVQAEWNYNWEGALLKLYSQPPAHAQFYLPWGGGVINADTIWMCGSSITVGTYANTLEFVYAQWTGPSFFSSTPQVTLSTPGTYVFEQSNPCGVTRDTFQLVALPYTLPVFTDAVFCNTPVSLTLDPGPGWSYSWSPGGATTQTLQVTAAGTYTVNLSNVCTSGSVTAHVEHQSYPVPDLNYLDPIYPICADSVLVLDPSPGYTYDTYQWQWSTGSATTPTLSVSGLTTGSDFYMVTVTQGSCSAMTGVEIRFFDQPVQPEICIVTVNTNLNKNMIVWTADNEPFPGHLQYSPAASYNIYKWAGGSNWTLLGNVLANQEHTFVDMTSQPPVVSARYKITMVDECGVESQKSSYHQTILLSVMSGANPGEVPLIWSEYRDESNMFVVDQYQIWRGNHPDSLEYYDQTPFTSYNDVNVVGQKYYQIVVTKSGGCDPSPVSTKGGSGNKTLITSSSSNIINNVTSTIATDHYPLSSLSVYPNPSSDGIFHIEGVQISYVEVMDALGRVVTVSTHSVLDLSALASGVYHARIFAPQGSTVKKLIKQ